MGIKMLTQVQASTFLSVDVLTHPAIMGYTVTKSQRNRGPHLYKDGQFFADHDGLLAMYKKGELGSIGSDGGKSTGVFGGDFQLRPTEILWASRRQCYSVETVVHCVRVFAMVAAR